MRALALALLLSAGPAMADGFPATLGGAYRLSDQHGQVRTEADPQGRMQLLFFGYATCQMICSVALPTMAAAADLAAERGVRLVPVMVTVDPDRDTAAAMAETLARAHPDFLGLTGDAAALQAAWDAFGVERSVVFQDITGPVYAHGSFIYLLAPDGTVLSVLPPILSPERIAEIAAARAGS